MKYVFYITESGVTAYAAEKSSESTQEFFMWSEPDNIENYLAQMPDFAEADVVLDLIDEELNFEWAPRVHSWEKSGIAQRKKQRLDNDSTLLSNVRWMGLLNQNEQGRKEELFLSATIADSHNVSSFLQNLEQAQIVLKNIHSKPFLLKEYFNKRVRSFLKLSRQDHKKPFLLVARQSENVFRQTFFYEGELRLSRLVELDSSHESVEEIRTALLAETKLAIAYVYNQKIIPFNAPIGFIFLDGEQATLEGILAQCQEEGLIRSSWEENEYFVGTANFRDVSNDGSICTDLSNSCFSQQAVSDFIITDSPKGFYQTTFTKKINALKSGATFLTVVNIGLFLFGMYYVLISGIDAWLSWEKQEMLQQKIVQHQNEKVRLQKMVQLQDDAQKIKASVEFSEAILELKVNRLISFNVNALSGAFLNNSNIQLADISWKTLDRFDSRRNQIQISAWVFPFYETYHDPVKWVDKFVADLQAIDGVESVQLQKEPLNRRVNQALKIQTDKGNVKALPFTVSLRIKDVESK